MPLGFLHLPRNACGLLLDSHCGSSFASARPKRSRLQRHLRTWWDIISLSLSAGRPGHVWPPCSVTLLEVDQHHRVHRECEVDSSRGRLSLFRHFSRRIALHWSPASLGLYILLRPQRYQTLGTFTIGSPILFMLGCHFSIRGPALGRRKCPLAREQICIPSTDTKLSHHVTL